MTRIKTVICSLSCCIAATLSPRNYIYVSLNCSHNCIVGTNVIAVWIMFRHDVSLSEWKTAFFLLYCFGLSWLYCDKTALVCRFSITSAGLALLGWSPGFCISTKTGLPAWRCVLNQWHACPDPCSTIKYYVFVAKNHSYKYIFIY